ERGLALLRARLHRSDGNAAAVVDHPAPAVGQERHVDARAEPRHRLVDRVVNDLANEVMQTRETGRTDVHAGPFTDRFEALEDLNLISTVRPVCLGLGGPRPGWGGLWRCFLADAHRLSCSRGVTG